MDIKRDGQPSSLRKIRRGTLFEALEEARDGRIPATLPPHGPIELHRGLEQVLGIYLTARELTPLLKGTRVTAASVRKSRAVRWVQVDRNLYYSLSDIRDFLRAR